MFSLAPRCHGECGRRSRRPCPAPPISCRAAPSPSPGPRQRVSHKLGKPRHLPDDGPALRAVAVRQVQRMTFGSTSPPACLWRSPSLRRCGRQEVAGVRTARSSTSGGRSEIITIGLGSAACASSGASVCGPCAHCWLLGDIALVSAPSPGCRWPGIWSRSMRSCPHYRGIPPRANGNCSGAQWTSTWPGRPP